MATELPFDTTTIRPDSDFVFVVAWHAGRDNLRGGQVRVGNDVEAHLRAACRTTLAEIPQLSAREYVPDMHAEAQDCIVLPLAADVTDSALIKFLFSDEPWQLLGPRELPRTPLALYAVIFGAGDDARAFVRKTNPHKVPTAGHIFATLGAALTRVNDQLFSLDARFDLLAAPTGLIALDQGAFESLFRKFPDEAVPNWVKELNECLPLAADGMERLAQQCQRNSYLRRRLSAILSRGHLKKSDVGKIKSHIVSVGLSPDDYIDADGKIVVDDGKVADLLYLLNEDFFLGGLSATRFRSDRKAPR